MVTHWIIWRTSTERELRGYIAKAIRQHEAALVSDTIEAIDPDLLAQWQRTIPLQRENGATVQSWLCAAPAAWRRSASTCAVMSCRQRVRRRRQWAR